MKSISLDFEVVASGLVFPEGPVAMNDGSVVLVEIGAGKVVKIEPDGTKSTVAMTGGGPNGAAIGPDGALYVCNNGGMRMHEREGLLIPGDRPENYSGGRIERINLESGAVEVLYTHVQDTPLCGPNDLVFDKQGGMWFTDLGKEYGRVGDRGAVFYAKPDGSLIREVEYPMRGPNGIGLSPDETKLYVAETHTGRLWSFDISHDGHILGQGPSKATCLYGSSGYQLYDSLAVDALGNICVATIINGGITSISPEGEAQHFHFPDFITTNICFGGDDMMDAWICLSSSGQLIKTRWPNPGLRLNYNA